MRKSARAKGRAGNGSASRPRTVVTEEIIRVLGEQQRKRGLAKWDDKDAVVAIYDLLLAMARHQMLREHDPSRDPTDFAHDAFLRLMQDDGAWVGRREFIVGAGEAMKRISCDEARKRLTKKRGGGWHRVPLEGV